MARIILATRASDLVGPLRVRGSFSELSVRWRAAAPVGELAPSSVVWGIPNSYLIRYIMNTYLNRHRLGVD